MSRFTEDQILICECNSSEHQMIVSYYKRDEKSFDPDEDYYVYCHIHLNKRKWWKRIKIGIRYIFGYQCRYGMFDEFLFQPDDVGKLQKLVDVLNERKEYFENLEWRIKEDNICPATKFPCTDECCPPGAICNLKPSQYFKPDAPNSERLNF